MSSDVDLVEQCTVKAVSCDVLLTSDSLANLEQYESIWYFVDRLRMPPKSPPRRGGPIAYGGFVGP